jgi:putative endonuclease
MFYIYVLHSSKDREFYFGFSSDLRKRLHEHNSGLVTATKTRLPMILVYYEAYLSKADALNRERQMKHFGKAWSTLKKRLQNSKKDALKVRG